LRYSIIDSASYRGEALTCTIIPLEGSEGERDKENDGDIRPPPHKRHIVAHRANKFIIQVAQNIAQTLPAPYPPWKKKKPSTQLVG
jgi:hypothetical protein